MQDGRILEEHPWTRCAVCSEKHGLPQESGLWSHLRPSEVIGELTQSLPQLLPLNHQRSSLQKEGNQIRGIHFGLNVRRGRGIFRADEVWPQARKALHLLAECRAINHPYTSVQVNMLTPSHSLPPHVDARNVGVTWVLSFGEYTGGQLQLKEQGQWKDVKNHLCWARIPEGVEHRVSSLKSGVRYSVVLYVPVGYEKALGQDDSSLASKLQELGYPVPSTMPPAFWCDVPEDVSLRQGKAEKTCVIVCLPPGWHQMPRHEQNVLVPRTGDDENKLVEHLNSSVKELWIILSPALCAYDSAWLRSLRKGDRRVMFLTFKRRPAGRQCDLSSDKYIQQTCSEHDYSQVVLLFFQGLCLGYRGESQEVCRQECPSSGQERCFAGQASSEYAPFPATSEQELQTLLRKAHEKMGHPHGEQFCRILRQAGASERVISLAKDLRCSVCQQCRPPRPPRVSAASLNVAFNSVVGLDVFHVQGVQDGTQMHVLNMLDWGTLYQVCVPIKDVSARRVRKAYRRYWLRVFGVPDRVVTDQGSEFVGAEMSERIESDGSYHELTPSESPWQNGRTERHGGVVKMMVTKARMSTPPNNIEELEEIVAACCQAKNQFSLSGGFSPAQRVFGTQLRVPGSNFPVEQRGTDYGVMSALEGNDPALQQSFRIRQAAREAFHHLDSSSRVKKPFFLGQEVNRIISLETSSTFGGEMRMFKPLGLSTSMPIGMALLWS